MSASSKNYIYICIYIYIYVWMLNLGPRDTGFKGLTWTRRASSSSRTGGHWVNTGSMWAEDLV